MGWIYDEHGKVIGHETKAEEHPANSLALPADKRCPACRSGLEIEYGFCKFGLGSFRRCMECFEVYGFELDNGE